MAEKTFITTESLDSVLKSLEKTGVSGSTADAVLIEWVLEKGNAKKRTFSYVEPFPSTVADCQPADFNPAFEHVNWVDGEDVVQADDSASTGKRGFNWHFNSIQDDLEELSARINKQVKCLADMRASLSKLLSEIRNEINYVHSHCCSGTTLQPPVITYPGNVYYPDMPGFPGYTRYPPATTLPGQKFPKGPLPYEYGNFMNKYKGTVNVDGIKYTMYDTPFGPQIGERVNTSTLPIFDGRGTEIVKKLVKIGSTDTDLKQLGSTAFSVESIAKKFGTKDLGDGDTLSTALNALPATTKYKGWNDMVNDFSQRVAGAMSIDPGYQTAVDILTGDGSAPSELGVSTVAGVSPALAGVLKQNNVSNVGQLAELSPDRLTELSGGKLNIDGASGVIAGAKTLTNFGHRPF